MSEGELVRDDGTTRPLDPHQILVQVEHSCLSPANLQNATSVAPGAALVGTVIAVGNAASACQDLRVVVPPVHSCGECESCQRGFVGACPTRIVLGIDIDGGCARSVVVDARWVTPLANGLESIPGDEAAFIAGPLLTAYGLFSRAGTGPGDLALVLGQGPVAGVLSVLAESRGVTLLQGSSLENAKSSIKEQNPSGKPMRIFVCDKAMSNESAVLLASPGSLIVTCLADGEIPMRAVLDSELTVLAVPFTHPDLLPETAALVAKGDLVIADLLVREAIAKQSPLSAQRAFEQGKCLIVYHDAL